MKKIAIIGLILFTFLACEKSDEVEKKATTGNVVGTVFNKATGEPRGGVNVSIGIYIEGPISKSGYVTGSDGRFSFENISASSMINAVWVEGVAGSRRGILVSPGETVTADISY
ncbi:MAG: carboxypeptidase-like regulatory domain-containing protein [Proteiniphilum sp.]|jgi:hypothetical protein|nr:carboxypeptidase-like regulatory domain-containing protein [Proteiniphilum sp.]